MNFQRFMSSILIAVCVIEVVSAGECRETVKRAVFGKKKKVLDDKIEFRREVQIAKDEVDLETKLNNPTEKLTVMAIIDENDTLTLSNVATVINSLERTNHDTIVMLVIDKTKCSTTASRYMDNNTRLPKYIFRKSNGNEISWYIRSDNDLRDYALLNHKIKELLGKTRVQVAFGDDELKKKCKENVDFQLKIIWFQDGNSYDRSKVDPDLHQPIVDAIADVNAQVLFIKANIYTCSVTHKEYRKKYPNLGNVSFVFYYLNEYIGFINGFSVENIKQVISNPRPFVFNASTKKIEYTEISAGDNDNNAD